MFDSVIPALTGVRSRLTVTLVRTSLTFVWLLSMLFTLSPAATAQTPPAGTVDLAAVKTYVVEQAALQKEASTQMVSLATRYFSLAQGTSFDYQAMWEANGPEISGLLSAVKTEWLKASTAYEMNEGLVAGIPSLSYFDVWIDAGPSGTDDPENALDWTLKLPNGTTLEKPGNIFHYLTEPLIWGTVDEYVSLKVDLDGDGNLELGEVLPEANLFMASSEVLEDATMQMQAAISEWEPTIEDAFTALVMMLPTMTEYFEQWKLSSFVAGQTSTERSFVATSRLFDVNGILNGLSLTYRELNPLVESIDPGLNAQITSGMANLVAFVSDLYQQEVDGKRFSAQEAELYGTEAQSRAMALTGQISQAIALLGVRV